MSERNHSLWSFLQSSKGYLSFQRLLISEKSRIRIFSEIVKVRPGERILDVGCGPGHALNYLECVEYAGVDQSAEYIQSARDSYPDRGHFMVGSAHKLTELQLPFAPTLVLGIGLLHHLDDEAAEQFFSETACLLQEGGRVVTLDPAFTTGQNPIARLLASQDRGKNVRSPEQYEAVARKIYNHVEGAIVTDLLRVPYSHFVLTAWRD